MTDKFNLPSQLQRIHARYPVGKRQPIIGITGNYGEQTCKLGEGYYKQIIAAGGTPLIIPPTADPSVLTTVLDRIDALLLSGGADINPLFMGEEPNPRLGGINSERDLPELLITRLAFNRQLPILGICRGIQTLAVALGGSVAQDIGATGTPEATGVCPLIKHSQEADRSEPTHSIKIEEGSILQDIYSNIPCSGSKFFTLHSSLFTLFVNSFHHQAVSTPGPHLRVAATAPDGIIEAVESSEHKPILGVQWHPECMGADGLPLFQWLVGEAALFHEVKTVHDHILTLDTHCDTPMLFPQGIDFATRDDRLLVDLHKMTEGRLDATIMVTYLPQNAWPVVGDASKRCCDSPVVGDASKRCCDSPVVGDASKRCNIPLSPKAYADSIFDRIEQMAADHADHLAIARTPQDLWQNKQAGRKSIMLGIENGLALEHDLQNLQHFAQRGIVYITLCHNGDNDICDSAKCLSESGKHLHGGVSDFGTSVIREMNRLGIMVDLSHAHERSFYDALDISSMPIVCSHSSARTLCDHPRNLTDEQMRVLAKKGGVCQITLYPGFLARENPCQNRGSEADILTAMQHLDHAIAVMGIDHVGLGTDFDGDGGVPGLANASELTNFTRRLLLRRYSEADIQKIWGGNFLRVMQQVQQVRS